MIDAIIISLVVVAVVCVIRAHLRATAQGQCSGCASKGSCSVVANPHDSAASCCIAAEKTVHSIDASVKRAVAQQKSSK